MPRDGAERGAKGVSEEGLGGPCGQQGRPCLPGRGEAVTMSLPGGSPALPPGLVCSLGVSGRQDEPLLWLTRGWGRAGTQEGQEAEESTVPLGLASAEQSAGPAWSTPSQGHSGSLCLLPGLLLAFSAPVSYTCPFLTICPPFPPQGCSPWSL